jgi:hypothetical protein
MCGLGCSDFTVTCKIAWIDPEGRPTPDNHRAIGLAVCYDPISFGEKGSEPIPICEAHATCKGKFWKLLPLPTQSADQIHPLVKADRDFKVIPDVVSASIKQAFSSQADEILKQLSWSGDHFSFNRWGMYVGVECDGYIHT